MSGLAPGVLPRAWVGRARLGSALKAGSCLFRIRRRVLRSSMAYFDVVHRVGNFPTRPSMEKIAWAWIAVIPAIREALALPSGLNRDPQLTKP